MEEQLYIQIRIGVTRLSLLNLVCFKMQIGSKDLTAFWSGRRATYSLIYVI